MKLLLIGPQGSGKSTQAELLAQFLGIPKIAIGDIFRQIAGQETSEGKRIKQILDTGQLVDDQVTAELVRNRLDSEKDGFIMDGYPRTVEQNNIFDPGFDKVVYLNVPREKVMERLMKRGRVDDTQNLIDKRLDLYYQQTQPLLDYYKKSGKLIEINGMGDIQNIQNEIKKSI